MDTLLRDWRTKHGLTLAEVSGVTGYSVAMLSRVERGQRRLSAIARIKLARALGVRVGDLFPLMFDVKANADDVDAPAADA